MSSVVKAYAISYGNDEKRVIDYNNAIKDKITLQREKMHNSDNDANDEDEEFVEGIGADTSVDNESSENLIYSEDDENGEKILAGSVVTDSHVEEAPSGIDMQAIEEKASQILDTARTDAEAIVSKANEQAGEVYEKAKQDGYQDGYSEGIKIASSELEEKKNELDINEQQIKDEYEKKKENMEPILVDAIVNVLMDVTHVFAEDKKDMVIELVNSVLRQNLISKNFLIRVSKDDVAYVKENKDKLLGATNKDIDIEVVLDNTLKKNECMIETDFGIFDCSLDIQLENLTRDIKLLACAVGNE